MVTINVVTRISQWQPSKAAFNAKLNIIFHQMKCDLSTVRIINFTAADAEPHKMAYPPQTLVAMRATEWREVTRGTNLKYRITTKRTSLSTGGSRSAIHNSRNPQRGA